MTYQIQQENGFRIVETHPHQVTIAGERAALDWIGICGEYATNRLLMYGSNLTPDFFDLKTGVAGAILLKFATYRIKTALVSTPAQVGEGRFREMVLEANRHNREFRVFYDRDLAVAWLFES